MTLSKNNYFQLLKNFIIKNGKEITILFLIIAIYNNLSHFIRKNILSDRIDFWDFHVYWCSANKFINGINPYGGETIKDCLTQFNFDLYFSYPPIVLRSISFLGNLNFIYAKILWILIIIFSFYLIIFFLRKIYSFKYLFFHFYFITFIYWWGTYLGIIASRKYFNNIICYIINWNLFFNKKKE